MKYRNSGKKLIRLDNGVCYEFVWCGMKKRREAGVGLLIRVDPEIELKEIYVSDPRLIAANLKIYGFNTRVVNVYSPTESGSEHQKDAFYRLLQKACKITKKHEKLIVAGDFNAKTSLVYDKCCYNGTNSITDNDCNDNGYRLKTFLLYQPT